MAKAKRYILRGQNDIVAVNKKTYKVFYKMRRHDKYLEESDAAHGLVSYNALDNEDYNGEEIICDRCEDSVDDIAVRNIMVEKLRKCLPLLSEDENRIITGVYFKNKSERKLALEIGMPPMTLHDKKIRILAKLETMMKN